MTQRIELGLLNSIRVQQDSDLKKYWNRKLSNSEENPFPLAPRDLVRAGLVNPGNYNLENSRFSFFSNSIMDMETTKLAKHPLVGSKPCPEIRVLGIGLTRGLNWIEKAVQLGFYVKAYDVSSVACQFLTILMNDIADWYKLEVVLGEVEDELKNPDVEQCETPIYFLSQFIQVQKKTKMIRIMRRLGNLLKRHPETGSVYIVHPLGSQNSTECYWGGKSFSFVEWGDTTPYEINDIVSAMGKRGTFDVEILGEHTYFHQKYSFLKIQFSSVKG